VSGVIPAPAGGGEFDYLLREPRHARRMLHITTGFVVLSAIACVVQLRLVNNESRQLALLRARLEVICETLAQLCMEMMSIRAGRRPPACGSSSRNMQHIDVKDAPTGVTVRSDFVVESPRQFGSGASNDETSDRH
jgi:hypothetical protein